MAKIVFFFSTNRWCLDAAILEWRFWSVLLNFQHWWWTGKLNLKPSLFKFLPYHQCTSICQYRWNPPLRISYIEKISQFEIAYASSETSLTHCGYLLFRQLYHAKEKNFHSRFLPFLNWVQIKNKYTVHTFSSKKSQSLGWKLGEIMFQFRTYRNYNMYYWNFLTKVRSF